jgi:hypothetical protein
LTIEVDGTTGTSSLALTDGSATYTFSSSTTGSHVVTATYSGDSTYAPSTGTLALTVGGSSSSGSFSLAAANLTVSAGSSGTSTITITPQNGYTGTIGWSVSTSSSLSNACYSLSDATVSGTSAVTTTMTVYTSESACANASAKGSNGKRLFTGGVMRSGIDNRPNSGFSPAKAGMSMGIALLVGLLGYRPKKFRAYAGVFLIVALSFGISSCSSSSSTNAAKGTYTLTIVGTDTSSSSITASTTMTLIID